MVSRNLKESGPLQITFISRSANLDKLLHINSRLFLNNKTKRKDNKTKTNNTETSINARYESKAIITQVNKSTIPLLNKMVTSAGRASVSLASLAARLALDCKREHTETIVAGLYETTLYNRIFCYQGARYFSDWLKTKISIFFSEYA